eukprot:5475071-Pyramimonas_sp.AAC.1
MGWIHRQKGRIHRLRGQHRTPAGAGVRSVASVGGEGTESRAPAGPRSPPPGPLQMCVRPLSDPCQTPPNIASMC